MQTWKTIKSTGGLYEASNDGQIKRTGSGHGSVVGRIKKQRELRPMGYKVVSLSVGNKPMTCLVHRLVAEAFFGECPNGMQVSHKDCNCKNNNIENLEYLTQSENNKNSVNVFGAYRGNRRRDSSMTAEKAKKIISDHSNGLGYKRLSKKHNISLSQARSISSGKTWSWVNE